MRAAQCQKCSDIRTVISSILAFGTLAYTLPIMLAGEENAAITVAFVLAICAIPPVTYNGVGLLIRGAQKLRLTRAQTPS